MGYQTKLNLKYLINLKLFVMKKLSKMIRLTNTDLSKITGGMHDQDSNCGETCWNTLGCTGQTGDEGYDSCEDDD